jgi:hypothetical protein
MMYAKLARDVEAALRAREYPVRVAYGPQRFDLEGPQMQVRVERDRDTPDDFRAAPGPRSDDSRPVAQRGVSLVWTLYTRSSAPGATAGEEEALLDQLVDAVYDALRMWASEARTSVDVVDGRLLNDDERGVEAISNGEAYRMRAIVPRGIYSLSYRGEGRPLAEIGAIGEGVLQVSIGADSSGDTTYETVDGAPVEFTAEFGEGFAS